MRYTSGLLPSASKKTSTLGLGAAAFGYAYSRQSGFQEAVDIIREAYSSGINFFDTAPWYGNNDGAAEKPFAEAFRGYDRSSFFMSTKCGWYGGDIKPPWNYRADVIEAGFKRSLQHLGMEYVDLLNVHSPEILEHDPQGYGVLFNEALPCVDRLRQRGLVKFIGITSQDLSLLKMFVEKSPVKIDTVLSWTKTTLVDFELKEYMKWFKERGVSVITASPLARGALLSNEAMMPKANHFSADLVAAVGEARSICKSNGVSLERIALGYCVEESEKCGIDLILTGPSSMNELRENTRVYLDGLNSTEKQVCKQLLNGPFGSSLKNRTVYNSKLEYLEHVPDNERLIN